MATADPASARSSPGASLADEDVDAGADDDRGAGEHRDLRNVAETKKPNTIAHTISVYWYGTTTQAGASLSERLTQTCAIIATTPRSASRTASRQVSATQ